MVRPILKDQPEEECASQFIDFLRKVIFQLLAHRPQDMEKVRKNFNAHISIEKSRAIAGPVAFYSVSNAFYQENTIAISELAKRCMISPASASRLVSWWVDNGLAERLSDDNDKRIIRVKITENGKQFHKITKKIALERVGSFLTALNHEEQIIFNLLINKFASKIDVPD